MGENQINTTLLPERSSESLILCPINFFNTQENQAKATLQNSFHQSYKSKA